MSNNTHTEIVCVLDQSGSMAHLTDATIAGFNKFLDEQRAAPGTANLTLVLFDTGWKVTVKSESVNLVPNLDRSSYKPDGGTALLDALGNAIRTIGDIAEQKPGSDVVFLIITDGGENSSTDFKRDQVKEIVAAREARGWQFIYLGANQDAFQEAGGIGTQNAMTMGYVSNAIGTASSYSYTSDTITSMRVAKAAGGSAKLSTAEVDKLKAKWKDGLEGKDEQPK